MQNCAIVTAHLPHSWAPQNKGETGFTWETWHSVHGLVLSRHSKSIWTNGKYLPDKNASFTPSAGISVRETLEKYSPAFPLPSCDISCLEVTGVGKGMEGKGKIPFFISFYLSCLRLGDIGFWIDFKAFVFVNCPPFWANVFLWPRNQSWAGSQGAVALVSLGCVYLGVTDEVKQRGWGTFCRRKSPEAIFCPEPTHLPQHKAVGEYIICMDTCSYTCMVFSIWYALQSK